MRNEKTAETSDLVVPQIGEGLHDVIVRELSKRPGDPFKRDEKLYVMETDKAIVDVEAPIDGVLEAWLVRENDVVRIGAPVARVTANNASTVVRDASEAGRRLDSKHGSGEQRLPSCLDPVIIPPRTRAYCSQQGLDADEISNIPASGAKLLPEDVDRYVLACKDNRAGVSGNDSTCLPEFREYPLTPQQKILSSRFRRTSQQAIPGTVGRFVEWTRVRTLADSFKQHSSRLRPSEFLLFAYCVAQASKCQPLFRSVLLGDSTIREYNSLQLGIAVGCPNGDLVTAVVSRADQLSLIEFIETLIRQVRRAIVRGDQATESMQLVLSYLGSYGIVDAIPVLAAPASAVLAVGSPVLNDNQVSTKLMLTVDHRLINGICAAKFLAAVNHESQTVKLPQEWIETHKEKGNDE